MRGGLPDVDSSFTTDSLREELARVYAERQDVAAYHAFTQREGARDLEQLANSGLSADDIETRIAALSTHGPSSFDMRQALALSPLDQTLIDVNKLRIEMVDKASATADLEADIADAMARAQRASLRADKVASAIVELEAIVAANKSTHGSDMTVLRQQAEAAKDTIAAAMEYEARRTAAGWDDAVEAALAKVRSGYTEQLDADANASLVDLLAYTDAARICAKDVAGAVLQDATLADEQHVQPLVVKLDASARHYQSMLANLGAAREYLAHLRGEVAAGRDPQTDLSEFLQQCLVAPPRMLSGISSTLKIDANTQRPSSPVASRAKPPVSPARGPGSKAREVSPSGKRPVDGFAEPTLPVSPQGAIHEAEVVLAPLRGMDGQLEARDAAEAGLDVSLARSELRAAIGDVTRKWFEVFSSHSEDHADTLASQLSFVADTQIAAALGFFQPLQVELARAPSSPTRAALLQYFSFSASDSASPMRLPNTATTLGQASGRIEVAGHAVPVSVAEEYRQLRKGRA